MARDYDPKALKFEWQRKILACRISDKTTAVALALSIHANKDGTNAHPGVQLLAHEAKAGESTVRRCLEELRELGLIRRTLRGSRAKGRNWADVYDLALPEDLEECVRVEPKPSPGPSRGKGRGGMANHVRWHERRDRTDPKCIHCTDPVEAFTNPSGSPHEDLSEGSVKGSEPIRPPLGRISDHRSDGSNHRSVQEHHHAFTPVLKDKHNPATPVAAARASSRETHPGRHAGSGPADPIRNPDGAGVRGRPRNRPQSGRGAAGRRAGADGDGPRQLRAPTARMTRGRWRGAGRVHGGIGPRHRMHPRRYPLPCAWMPVSYGSMPVRSGFEATVVVER